MSVMRCKEAQIENENIYWKTFLNVFYIHLTQIYSVYMTPLYFGGLCISLIEKYPPKHTAHTPGISLEMPWKWYLLRVGRNKILRPKDSTWRNSAKRAYGRNGKIRQKLIYIGKIHSRNPFNKHLQNWTVSICKLTEAGKSLGSKFHYTNSVSFCGRRNFSRREKRRYRVVRYH